MPERKRLPMLGRLLEALRHADAPRPARPPVEGRPETPVVDPGDRQMTWMFDQSRCIGCNACVIACKDWNGVEAGGPSWRRIYEIEMGDYPALNMAHLSLSCNHCRNAPCIPACPNGAITKRASDGVVLIDRAKCKGALECLKACPYGAPQYGNEPGQRRMQKCTFCVDRLDRDLNPACVDACIMRALDAGPFAALRARHPEAVDPSRERVDGFADTSANAAGEPLATGPSRPSILIKRRARREGAETFPVTIRRNGRIEDPPNMLRGFRAPLAGK